MSDDNHFLFTAPVMLAYPALVKPRAYMKNNVAKGEPKFSCSFVFRPDHPDFAALRAKVSSVASPGAKLPFKKGDTLADKRAKTLSAAGKDEKIKGGDFMRGMVVLKAASLFRPDLAVIDQGRIVVLERSTPDPEIWLAKYGERFFFGAECYPLLAFKPYTTDADEHGVTVYLQQLMVNGKGTRIGGAPKRSAADTFSAYLGKHTLEDPTAVENWDAA